MPKLLLAMRWLLWKGLFLTTFVLILVVGVLSMYMPDTQWQKLFSVFSLAAEVSILAFLGVNVAEAARSKQQRFEFFQERCFECLSRLSSLEGKILNPSENSKEVFELATVINKEIGAALIALKTNFKDIVDPVHVHYCRWKVQLFAGLEPNRNKFCASTDAKIELSDEFLKLRSAFLTAYEKISSK